MSCTRKVRIHLNSGCSTPFIHQPIYIQLSIANKWVPPNGPIRIPPRGDTAKSPKTPVSSIAGAIRGALLSAGNTGRAKVRNVSPISTSKSPKSKATNFSFTFETNAAEIDYGVTGISIKKGKDKRPSSTQLKIAIEVGSGRHRFRVKKVPGDRVFQAGIDLGWKSKRQLLLPEQVRFRSEDYKPGEGGISGDKILRSSPFQYSDLDWLALPSAFWQPEQLQTMPAWQTDAIVRGFTYGPLTDLAMRDLFVEPPDDSEPSHNLSIIRKDDSRKGGDDNMEAGD